MEDTRLANRNWNVGGDDGKARDWDCVKIAVLMDIRDELQKLNRLLGCSNFLSIPATLRSIRRNTHKLRPPKKRKRK